ncbi:MAG: biopolymer transporter ExbD [Phycisphaera sp.]|jgi:biopolymer transport protein ExbD|nr:biopolymer transporter ExbD [Phycisphaera sp.]
MGRFRSSSTTGGDEPSIDLGPMLDCVFILLIFFIVTTTFVDETGVEVDKPQAASAVQLEKTSIMLAITKKGEVVYGGREIGVNGVQTLVKRMIAKEQVPVIIQADKEAPAGLLVRVLDESKLAGATKVSVASAKNR